MPTDFFVSYTSTDTNWAEWIAWVLEAEGSTTKLQAWDFTPGSNFVLEMHRAAAEADRTLALLSPDYLKSQFGAPEWAAAFTADPEGFKRRLVPIRIRECRPQGLLAAVVYIDLVGMSESDAQQTLLNGLSGQRAKPTQRPGFPGSNQPDQRPRHPDFPGTPRASLASRGAIHYVPTVQRMPSDLDKRRFSNQAFEIITQHFDRSLSELSASDPRIEYEVKRANPTKYIAELFVDGEKRTQCKIWVGGMHSTNSIAFSDSNFDWSGDNSCNELLTLKPNSLAFVATMAMGYHKERRGLDLNDLTPEDAAEYLWRRFASPLER